MTNLAFFLMKNYFFLYLFCFILVWTCTQNTRHTPFFNHRIPVDTTLFSPMKAWANIQTNRIEEASGMTICRTNPNYFWTINDSGGNAEVYLVSLKGEFAGTIALPKHIKNRDWEEICSYTEPNTQKQYLYIGEIGDNRAIYPNKIIYRIVAPEIKNISSPLWWLAKEVKSMTFKFPDKQRDAEAFIIEPQTADFYIFSKREDTIQVYYTPATNLGKENVVVEKIAKIPAKNVVAADISPDGQEILLKDYDNIYYWRRGDKETLKQLFNRLPIRLPYTAEPQGEAIAWLPNKAGFFTLSEDNPTVKQVLYFYARKSKSGG